MKRQRVDRRAEAVRGSEWCSFAFGEHFRTRCLEGGVLLTPGSACGSDYVTHLRLCFTSVAPPALDDALDRLRGLLTP